MELLKKKIRKYGAATFGTFRAGSLVAIFDTIDLERGESPWS